MRVLVLDDDWERIRWFAQRVEVQGGHRVDYAMVASEAVRLLDEAEMGGWGYGGIFLDHDLEPVHYEAYLRDPSGETWEPWLLATTGRAVAGWLANHPGASPAAHIIVHSYNRQGAAAMVAALRAAGRPAQYVPFSALGTVRSAILRGREG